MNYTQLNHASKIIRLRRLLSIQSKILGAVGIVGLAVVYLMILLGIN